MTNIIILHAFMLSIHSSYYFSFKINCSESYFTATQLLLTLILTDLVQVIKPYVAWYIIKILCLITYINGCMSENADLPLRRM